MKIRFRINRASLLRFCLLGLIFAGVFLVGVWSAGAVFYAFGWSPVGAVVYSGVLLGCWLVGFLRRKLLLIPASMEFVVIVAFAAMTPERVFAETVWQAPWGRVPSVEVDANPITVRNVRDFRYRSVDDYEIRYIDFAFDPSTVRTVDVAVSHWDGMQAIAHTMLSFGFEDGRYLAVSMETRLPVGVEQGFLPGFYRQYELLMVLATEEDLFRLRTNFRKEELYLYRTNATPEQARALLDSIMRRADTLSKQPEFYNSIARNCTTSLAPLLRVIDPTFEGDLRLLLNGYSDELLFELGYLKCREGESFPDLKRRRLANRYVSQPSDLPYSRLIRTDL